MESNNGAIQIVEATAVESMERAMVDMQIATAKRYPRPPLSKIRENVMDVATLDEETAASCFYTLPRGGKAIQGESIRLLEIAITQYQNARVQTRVIDTVTTGDAPHVIVQGVAFDLEKNVAYSLEKRRRITKKKFKDAIDEDDINLAVNSCSAIAYRDAGLKMVGRAFLKPIFEAVKKVAIGDIRSLVAKRTEVIDRLNKMGAPLDRILAVIEARTPDDITVEKLQQLIGLGTALKDGETTLEDAFPMIPKEEPPAKGNAAVAEKLKGKKVVEPPKSDTKPAEENKGKLPVPDVNELRAKWVCDVCGQFVVELKKNDKGKAVCPHKNCLAVGEVRETNDKDFEPAK